MTPEEQRNAEKAQLGRKLHAEMKEVLRLADPDTDDVLRRQGYGTVEIASMRQLLVRNACACIREGAKLDTVYQADGKAPLILAMEIYLVTGDATIFNAMINREVNPAKINQQWDFENKFIMLMRGTVKKPTQHLDGLLTLLEGTKGGRKLLENCWPFIATDVTTLYSRYFSLPPVLQTFQKHGYDVKGKVSDEVMVIVVGDFKLNLDWCKRNPTDPEAKTLKPVIEALLTHYAPEPSAAPTPPAPAPAPAPAPQVQGGSVEPARVERVQANGQARKQ